MRLALLTGRGGAVVGPGDPVVAGTPPVDGAITVRVEAAGGATVVHRMAAELQAAQDRGLAPTSADRIAPLFTVGTLVVAALTLAGWWAARGLGPSPSPIPWRCWRGRPRALALAHPLAAAAGLASAARRGLLLRSSDALLRLSDVTVAGLDKTGTITAGTITVTEASDATLRVAAGLERYSVHPIARAITAEAARRGIPLPQPRDVRELPGTGISGEIDGRRWSLASAGAGAVRLAAEDETGACAGADPARRHDPRRCPAGGRGAPPPRRPERAAHGRPRRRGRARGAGRGHQRGAGAPRPCGQVGVGAGAAAGRRAGRSSPGTVSMTAPPLPPPTWASPWPAVPRARCWSPMASSPPARWARWSRASGPASGPAHGELEPAPAAIIYNVVSVGAAALGLVNPLVAAVLMPILSTLVIWNATRVERLMRSGD